MSLRGSLLRNFGAGLLLCLTVWGVASSPFARVWFPLGVGFYFFALWRSPLLWLFVIPALLPVLDLSPWSGRFFFGAFDFVVWGTWAVLLLKPSGPEFPRSRLPAPALWLAGLLAASFLISAFVGLLPLQPLDTNAFSNYYSRYNSLRVFKGVFYAWGFFPFLRSGLDSRARFERYFLPGIIAGLCGVGVVALWERQIFTGLFNFSIDFRITSTFYGMHIGGAYLEAYLAVVLPFVAGCFCLLKGIRWYWVGIVALGLGLYTELMTFSRIGYFSFGVSAVILFSALLYIYSKKAKVVFASCWVLFLVILLAVPVLRGNYIQDRFAKSVQDAEVRFSHWKGALNMMDENWGARLFGMGLGSYPRTYFQTHSGKIGPSSYSYVKENNNTFLRLSSGDPLYLGQKVSLQPFQNYTLKLDLRSQNEMAILNIPVCEKSLLHSFDCRWLKQKVGNTDGQWRTFGQTFTSGTMGEGNSLFQGAPVELAFYNGIKDTNVDIDNVYLIDEAGTDLLQNGDFSRGNDFWFFTIDNHLPWHIFNLWIHLIFESGWIGFLLFNCFVGYTIFHLVKGILRKDPLAAILLASIGGFLIVGIIGSLFDSPRISLLFFFISFVSLLTPTAGVDRGYGVTTLVDS